MKVAIPCLLILGCLAGRLLAAEEAPVFAQDFQQVELGRPPADLLILDGAFAVRAEGEERFLELPGAPLDTFGVLFGPTLTNNAAVTGRIWGTASGRRFPSFALGLGGINGFKVRVSPGKKELELLRGETVLRQLPFAWRSGTWTRLRLQIRQDGNVWKIEGRAWPADQPEPKDWMLSVEESEPPRPGRASLWGAPYSGTPIRFDDLELTQVRPAS